MRRTNTFTVRPCTEQDKQLLHELLDASASLWNELTYERRQNYFEGESIWETDDYRKWYVGVLGSATAQQLIRKSKSAWNSFFSLKEKGKYAKYEEGVSTVYVVALTDILDTHWSVRANAKTHNFWAFRAFIDRLEDTAEEYDITVEERSEAWTSQECPQCGSTERTTRHRDTLTCECGFEGADLTASETFLRRQTDVPRPMAWPVCLKWDDHSWSESPHSHRPNEEHTHRSIRYLSEKVAHVGGRHD